MTSDTDPLDQLIKDMMQSLKQGTSPDPEVYDAVKQDPLLSLRLIDLIQAIDEGPLDEDDLYYAACICVFEMSVAQGQLDVERGYKLGAKHLRQLMAYLAHQITTTQHSLNFWLPLLNAFYEADVELSSELKDAYIQIANTAEEQPSLHEESIYLDSMRAMIHELSDLSVFEITDHFFAQAHAMPPEFYGDLVIDLYSIEEGKEIALLTLLHPNPAVRDIVVETLDQLLNDITLSAVSLSRLRMIQQWYPKDYHPQFEQWITNQRKKGVVFYKPPPASLVSVHATEVDSISTQGLFIHFKIHHKHQLCGILLNANHGIKDAWISDVLSLKDIRGYQREAIKTSFQMRPVDNAYLSIVNHFLSVMIARGRLPDLHFLAIEEALGMHWRPQPLNVKEVLEQLAVNKTPFTPAQITDALRHSKTWPRKKPYTESWYLESAEIDKLVNQCCSFIDGIKVCQFEKAMEAVFTQIIETHREQWVFHFLWVSLWLQSKRKKKETMGSDSFFIAYIIQTAVIPINTIPIMRAICYHSVLNSIETMHERGTYLT